MVTFAPENAAAFSVYSLLAMRVFGAGNNCAIVYGQDTFEFDQGHVTKNKPITVLVLLSKSLGI